MRATTLLGWKVTVFPAFRAEWGIRATRLGDDYEGVPLTPWIFLFPYPSRFLP
jgi:hypothetical protein